MFRFYITRCFQKCIMVLRLYCTVLLKSSLVFYWSGTPFAPGTSTIPLSQLQQHSLALQSSPGQTASSTPNHPQQNQQAVFRLPATVSLTGERVRSCSSGLDIIMDRLFKSNLCSYRIGILKMFCAFGLDHSLSKHFSEIGICLIQNKLWIILFPSDFRNK